ncbi:hypothetical protein FQN55_008313 [Onygenales sp. PD_40]|nr:hypothetical protein FQN55_008313 [Onygenales sp. PD_40]KAK2784848.1 hypothetical protein FQN53_008181 [Emmonsiellopsis sp. PD_33]
MLPSISLLLIPLLLTTSLISASPAPNSNLSPRAFGTFSDLTIFTPPSNYTDPRVLYARTALIPSTNTLLATWENYSPEPPIVHFPIYRSTDGGESWTEISHVTDTQNNWGLRYQPDLYVLPQPIGDFPAGTILCAGNSIPTDLSQSQIDLYASTDDGASWTFLSHIAAGGEARPNNGLTPVWEPFMMVYQDTLIMYYSDQRDPAHGQKLVHQTSVDLLTWADPVDDVAYAEYTARPGMPTVSQLPDGRYLYTYEYGGGPGFDTYSFPVYYRISADPLDFLNAAEYPLVVAADGTRPTGSPYNVWMDVGGEDGAIVVSSGSQSEIFVNRALGREDAWEKISTEEKTSYTRHLRAMKEPGHLLIMGGGVLPPSDTNVVSVGVMDLEAALGA